MFSLNWMGFAALSAASSLFLVRFRDGFVRLERRDLLLDLFGWLRELLGLRVDAGYDHRYIERHVVKFGEAGEAVPLGDSLGLRTSTPSPAGMMEGAVGQ
jgi:hypothetical protein